MLASNPSEGKLEPLDDQEVELIPTEREPLFIKPKKGISLYRNINWREWSSNKSKGGITRMKML
jgi:hypothetical protein